MCDAWYSDYDSKSCFMAPLLTPPKGMKEASEFTEYTLQMRQELSKRMVDRLYPDESKAIDFPLWMNFNKKKFMSLKY